MYLIKEYREKEEIYLGHKITAEHMVYIKNGKPIRQLSFWIYLKNTRWELTGLLFNERCDGDKLTSINDCIIEAKKCIDISYKYKFITQHE